MNVDRVLENNALPFAAPFHLEDHRGFDTIVVVAKLAWQVGPNGRVRLAVPQRPIRLTAELRGGASSSIRYPSDHYCEKSGTDVIMLAKAYPPEGAEVRELDVSLRIEAASGTIAKRVRAFGPRVFVKKIRGVVPGPAELLSEPLPLCYEHAEGGTDPEDPAIRSATNPVGIGHVRDKAKLVGSEAYRLEPLDGKSPAGFGPIAAQWSPRRERYGTTDEAYYRRRYPVAPEDFDLRHNSDAHPDLWSETPLSGDEPIEILGATPEGAWRFKLPFYEPRFDLTMDDESRRLETHLDSMLIDIEDPGRRLVELCWRVCVRLPRKSERLDRIVVTNAIDVDRHYYDELRAEASPAPQELH